MKSWWSNLNLREQIILAIAGVIGIVIVLDSLVIDGYRLKSNQLEEQIEQAKDDLNWMQQAVHRIPMQKAGKSRAVTGRVVTFVDRQITKLGLKKQMQQMTPIKNHSVRIRLSEISFNQLLKFFSTIEGSAIIEEVRILPADKQGYVNVSLVVSNENKAS